MKPKPKKEFLTRRRWKHCVQALSCLVVFCTVYMLILPVITLEAKSYCGKEEHSHSPDCFIEIEQCGLIEHEHDEFCCDDEGSLVCPLDEHIHDDSCSDRILECGKTNVIKFSNCQPLARQFSVRSEAFCISLIFWPFSKWQWFSYTSSSFRKSF